MMNFIKRIFPTAILIILLCENISLAAFQSGDVYNSDINGFLDGYPIPVYSYMDYPYILARDLLGYGFDVEYNESTRSATITKNIAKSMYPYSNVGNSDNKTKKLGTIQKSDIKVFINNKEIPSYNMNDNMLICMDDLYRFGKVNWYDDSKTIAFTSNGFITANPLWETSMPIKYKNYRNNKVKTIKNNYYPNTNIPDFSVLTNAQLKQVQPSDNLTAYIYVLDEESAVQYITLLCDYMGFTISDKDSDIFGSYVTYYLSKQSSVAAVSIQYTSDEIWIIPG